MSSRPVGSPVTRRSAAGAGSPSLESRLQACYGNLPASEKAVADVLLNQPGRLTTHSATELAKVAGVSKAAVTRLIQRLGYPRYTAARLAAREARHWGAPMYQELVATAQDGVEGALSKHVFNDQQLLDQTMSVLLKADLSGAVSLLARARRIVVIGFRNSAWLAMYARSQLGLLRAGVELAPQSAETLAEGLIDLKAEDVVLAIGFRRRVPALAAALQASRQANAAIVLITDPSGAADLPSADKTLICHCQGDSIFDSYVAAVSLINFLAMQLAQSLGSAARRRLQSAEHWHKALGDLA